MNRRCNRVASARPMISFLQRVTGQLLGLMSDKALCLEILCSPIHCGNCKSSMAKTSSGPITSFSIMELKSGASVLSEERHTFVPGLEFPGFRKDAQLLRCQHPRKHPLQSTIPYAEKN